MQQETVFATFLGAIVGGLTTWLVAWIYYKKAGDELLAESKKLKNAADLILWKLQNPKVETGLIYNEKGEVSGITANMNAKL